jgi:hypothetical protein
MSTGFFGESGSNFWEVFNLIRTGFRLGQLVSLVKVDPTVGEFFYLIRTGFRLGQLVSLVKVDPTFCNFLPY